MRHFISTLIALFILSYSFAQSPKRYLDNAQALANQGDFEKAITVCDMGLAKFPNEPMFHVVKGEAIAKYIDRITVDEEVYKRSMEEFELALKIDNDLLDAYYGRAMVNMFHQKYDRTIKDLNRILELGEEELPDEFRSGIFALRASAKSYSRDYDGALLDYQKALEANPDNYYVYISQGIAYSDLKQYDKAFEVFDKAMAKDSLHPQLLNNYGLVKIETEEYHDADSILTYALEIYPEEAYLLNNLGLAKVKLGDIDKGLELINHSLEIHETNSYAYKHRAIAYIALGEIEKACEDLKKANELGYSISYNEEVNELIEENCKE